MQPFDGVRKWMRGRAERRAAPPAQHCTGCRSPIPGGTDEEHRAAGGVLLAGAGWFCSDRCEQQYRLRFRIGFAPTPAAGTPRTPSRPIRAAPPSPPVGASTPEEATEPPAPARRSAADALSAALRERRKKLSNGV